MDFSQLNSAEQAQMSKILEKKQVEFFFPQTRVVLVSLNGQTMLDARLPEDVF